MPTLADDGKAEAALENCRRLKSISLGVCCKQQTPDGYTDVSPFFEHKPKKNVRFAIQFANRNVLTMSNADAARTRKGAAKRWKEFSGTVK